MNNPWNLSPREAQVMCCFAEGASTAKDVGEKLGISHKTVDIHVSNALAGMNAPSRLQAVLLWDRANRGAA